MKRSMPMKVLLAAITCEKGDIDGNLARHRAVLEEARQAGCDLAVFPEFSLTGSVDPVSHPERAITLDHPAVAQLTHAATECGVAARNCDDSATAASTSDACTARKPNFSAKKSLAFSVMR